MKAEPQIRTATHKLRPSGSPGLASPDDPFRDDLFAAVERAPAGPAHSSQASRKEILSETWFFALPRVSAAEAEASAAIASLPEEFYDEVSAAAATTIARSSLNSPDLISICANHILETDFSLSFTAPRAPQIFAVFDVAGQQTPIVLELDAHFLIRLVDRLLGGRGVGPDTLRSLTTAERAVIEFLFLSIASELDLQLGAPLMSLQSLGEQPPWQLSTDDQAGKSWGRGLTVAMRIDVGDIGGIAKVHFPAMALREINRNLEQLNRTRLNPEPHGAAAKVRRYAAIVPDVALSILVGKTKLTREEFLLLESGDVMVIEYPELACHDGSFHGRLRLRVADGDAAWISGVVAEPDPINARALTLSVESIAIGESGAPAERLQMEQELEATESSPEEPNMIDGVMLTVHVELATRRVRLDELTRLRANQVLDLGCKATDPVDLVVDGHHVARGELVDIEGRLGVRIKQVATKVA